MKEIKKDLFNAFIIAMAFTGVATWIVWIDGFINVVMK